MSRVRNRFGNGGAASPARTRARLAIGAAMGALVLLAAACGPQPPADDSDPSPPANVYDAACAGKLVASTPGSVASAELGELSGIVASREHVGVWWAHNDSGGAARVYALGDDGRDLGRFDLDGATNVDWEDIAVGPGPVAGTQYLYVADTGDFSVSKGSTRDEVVVYRVPEPAVDASASPPGNAVSLAGVDELTLTYPGGAKHDAEALLVDPATGELFLVTKDWSQGGVGIVFRAPANLAAGSSTVLTQVATVSLGGTQMVTGGDVTPDGAFVAIRTHTLLSGGKVTLYPRPAGSPLQAAFGETACEGGTPTGAQFEAIGFTPDGRGYVTVSEGANPPLHRYAAP